MFGQMMIERIKMDGKAINRDNDGVTDDMNPIQFKPSPVDRFFFVLGEAMINYGHRLKDRPRASLKADKAKSPDFLIML